jgi:hypothetical protein
LIGFGNLVGSLSHSVLYLQGVLPQHSPSSDFGENQLSRGLISLSLLLSSHLRIFQHSRVRSFTWCYPGFNLLKSRSPPLRVYCPRLGRAVDTRFPFASTAKRLRLATDNNSQTHYAKGKQSPRPPGRTGLTAEWAWLLHIVGIWFQVLFHSPSRGSFHLSLAVLVHYRLPRSI